MESISLKKLAEAVGAECTDDIEISSVCTDTRKIEKGCLFVALKGERFDGHEFLEQAYARGASAVLSERPAPGHTGVVLVKDTGRALLDLAKYYRSLFRVFVAGVTGSVGKTSTKEMIAAILSVSGKTLKTEGNLNNEIGMPLTVLRLDSECKNAVFEMGMSNFGEISALAKVCRPHVGVITNIGVSHMETLGSQENILKAKLEITDGMADDAPLILNGDDPFLRAVSGRMERPVLYYGIDSNADVTASDIQTGDGATSFTIHYYGRSLSASIPLVGRHNVYNALAGFCVGLVAEMKPEDIVRGMRQYKNAALRQNVTVKNGVTVISDCYNASPASMLAALDVLMNIGCTGRRIGVFGDMLELGSVSEESHVEVGKAACRAGVDILLCYGNRARGIQQGALSEGMKPVYHFTEKKVLAEFLRQTLRPGDAVIYKASRGMELEDVIKMVDEEMGE